MPVLRGQACGVCMRTVYLVVWLLVLPSKLWEVSPPLSRVFLGLAGPKMAKRVSALSAVPFWFKDSMMLSVVRMLPRYLGASLSCKKPTQKTSRPGDFEPAKHVLKDQVVGESGGTDPWISGPGHPSRQDGKGRDPSRIRRERDLELGVS